MHMSLHHFFVSAGLLLTSTCFAQRLGAIREYHIQPSVKIERYGIPWAEKGVATVTGYEAVKGKGPETGIHFSIPLDGGAITEQRWTDREGLEGEVGAVTIEEGEAVSWMVLLLWDRRTGVVDLVHQHYDQDTRQYQGPREKFGEIALDPKSYEGSRIVLWHRISPDSSKVLLYYDQIQHQGVKQAMCWVLDMEGELLWKGNYQLPVQARGAQTELLFNNAGQALVGMTAVVLDDDNSRTKKDGSVKAEVENFYGNKTRATVYLLFGEQFLKWDGGLGKDEEMIFLRMLDTPKGFDFVACTRTGERKNATYAWVYGHLNNGLKPEVVSTGKLNGPLVKVVHDRAGMSYLLSTEDEGLAVTQLNSAGAMGWRHVGTFPKMPPLFDFRIISGHLVHDHRWTRSDLKAMQNGKAPAVMSFGTEGIPTVMVWRDGQRIITPLLPVETRDKDLPSRAILSEEGLMMQAAKDETHLSFIPITWD